MTACRFVLLVVEAAVSLYIDSFEIQADEISVHPGMNNSVTRQCSARSNYCHKTV